MKGLVKWFDPKAKIKRWIFLSLIGVSLVCYGMANVLVSETLEIADMLWIMATFVVGFVMIVFSIIHIQKRTLELLVESSDTRKETNNVKTLIFNKKVYNQGPKVVVIGGGTGLNSVLRGLKNYTDNITAIVTVSDYGKTPTDSRRALQVLPMNDIKSSLSALAYDEEMMSKLLDYKHNDGRLNTLTFGDIFFSTMNKIYGNFSQSIEEVSKVFNMTGRVLPVTLEEIKICAELEDGMVIEDKEKIPEIVSGTTKRISRIFIKPTNCKPAPGVIEAIREADAIIIGPGSLYTNVIPNLLVNGIAREIKLSKAMKVYVSNIMTEFGQTDDYTLSEHIKAIQDYLGEGIVEYCIYDTGEIIPEYIHRYNIEGSDIVLPDTQKAKALGVKLIQRNLSKIEDGVIRHDPDIIASTIIQLVCDELEFADMENDSQYMTLNSKLIETKREMKKRERAEKKFNKSGKKPFERREPQFKSKFNTKYKERMQSIRESSKKNIEQKEKSKLFDIEKENSEVYGNNTVKEMNKTYENSLFKENKDTYENSSFKENNEKHEISNKLKEISSIFKSKPKNDEKPKSKNTPAIENNLVEKKNESNYEEEKKVAKYENNLADEKIVNNTEKEKTYISNEENKSSENYGSNIINESYKKEENIIEKDESKTEKNSSDESKLLLGNHTIEETIKMYNELLKRQKELLENNNNESKEDITNKTNENE